MSVRDLLRSNDERFRALAAGLRDDEWTRPSLCDAWSNHDVLAHLVIGYRSGPGVTAGEILRHGGSFDRANTAMACSLAADRSPAELLDEFARLVYRPRGLGRVFPPRLLLGDHVTHELDILFAIDREPQHCPRSGGGSAQHPSRAAQSVRARVPQQPRTAAARHRRRLGTRRQGAARRGPRRRTGVRSGQPAANAACAAR